MCGIIHVIICLYVENSRMKTAFCFDLDGTVTTQEILPLISKEVDLHEEINLLTQLTLDGLIPFQNSFKLRVKLLSTIPINKVAEIVSEVELDSKILAFIQEHRHDCFIVTGNLDVWVAEMIKSKIRCDYFSSEAIYSQNRLDGIKKILIKGEVIRQLRSRYDRIVAIGDSMNDCPMFQEADVKIAFGGTHNPVYSLIKLSDYVTFDSGSLISILENYK